MEKFSPSVENSNGKLASSTGVFYLLMSGKVNSEKLQEVIHYLTESSTSSYQSEEISKMIKVFIKWGKENGINFTDQPIYEGF